MGNKFYWGLGILIVLLIGAFVFIMVNEHAENDQIEAEAKEAEDLADSINRRKSENRPPPPGKSFEGGGHWHGDEWHDAPHEPSIANGKNTEYPTQATHPVSTYKGSLTYHEELLETNPFEALRQQSKEMNHWSADYIPDYPPEDVAAHDFARVEYLKRYISVTGEVPSGVNQVQLDRLFDKGMDELHRRLEAGEKRFTELTWTHMEPPVRWSEDGFPMWY